ncbi:helix-turn-helix domain-containing protein [Pseudomonas sp. NyZ201]|uniref:helix-turn-helix domain-containing protein n=1 Tax=Pseudomonas sp. NyZ201 TaxID=3409857 RepID=UPI003CEDD991
MKTYLLKLLDPTQDQLSSAAVAANAMEELAEDLEEAVYSPDRLDIDRLSRDLLEMSSSLIRSLPEKAKSVISGRSKESSDFDKLFLIGQLTFAQHFASVIASKRPQKEFMEVMEADWVAPYLDALYFQDLSSGQLAEVIKCEKATVSRNLRKLREAGVADFKKKGKFTINYLTSAAMEVWSAVLSDAPTNQVEGLRAKRNRLEDGTEHEYTNIAVREMIESLTGKSTSDFLSSMPTMDAPA